MLYEPPCHGVQVSRPVIIQPCAIIFPPRVLERIRGSSRHRRLSKRFIQITRLDSASLIGKVQRRAQRIRVVELIARTELPHKRLVDVQTSQIGCPDRSATSFGDNIVSVKYESCVQSIDRLAGSPSQRIIGERCRGSSADADQSVSGIPQVCLGAIAREIPVGIVGQRGPSKLRLLVGGIIARRRNRIRQQARGSVRSIGQEPIARRIIRVAERVDDAAWAVMGDAGQSRGEIVDVAGRGTIRIRETRAAICIVITERCEQGALLTRVKREAASY